MRNKYTIKKLERNPLVCFFLLGGRNALGIPLLCLGLTPIEGFAKVCDLEYLGLAEQFVYELAPPVDQFGQRGFGCSRASLRYSLEKPCCVRSVLPEADIDLNTDWKEGGMVGVVVFRDPQSVDTHLNRVVRPVEAKLVLSAWLKREVVLRQGLQEIVVLAGCALRSSGHSGAVRVVLALALELQRPLHGPDPLLIVEAKVNFVGFCRLVVDGRPDHEGVPAGDRLGQVHAKPGYRGARIVSRSDLILAQRDLNVSGSCRCRNE